LKRTSSTISSTQWKNGSPERCCSWRGTELEDGAPQRIVPRLSQEALAEIVGTTRGRVNFFMNKFRQMGYMDYNGGIKVKPTLLSVVLHP